MLRQLSQAERDLRRIGEFIRGILSNIKKIPTPKSTDKSDICLYSACKDMGILIFVG
jgi:hypothetical protein